MIRSLYSGVLGMKNHQIRMDVIGNNISNVNTTGFKAARANFQDVMYQMVKKGGVSSNPAQAGIGINVASINTYMNPGGLQPTGRTLDLGISGSGFFKLRDGGVEYYTREGIFYLTNGGAMVNSSGYTVVGQTWNKARNDVTITDPDAVIKAAGVASFDDDDGGGGTITKTISIKPADAASSTVLKDYKIVFGNGGGHSLTPGVPGVVYLDINDGTNPLTDTNSIQNAISNLFSNNVKVTVSVDNPAGIVDPINLDGCEITTAKSLFLQGLHADGSEVTTPVEIDLTSSTDLSLDQVIDKINAVQQKSGVKAYKYTDDNGDIKLVLTTVFNGHQEYDSQYQLQISNMGFLTGDTDIFAQAGIGALTEAEIIIDEKNIPIADLTIQSDGVISGIDTNNIPLMFAGGKDGARIILYNFSNQDGLERYKNNLFKESISSGPEKGGVPGSNGYGTIESGYLEMSNVELTDEFSNMITTQRGYQANSRIITVSDTMLEELLNLKR